MTEQEISNRMAEARAIARINPVPADAVSRINSLAEGVPSPYDELIRSMVEAVAGEPNG